MCRRTTSLNSLLLLFFIRFLLHVNGAAVGQKDLCPYADTVNITEGLRLKDGSYSYQGLIIPANLTAEYYMKVIDGIEYGTERHTRGCVCRLKACITFCCPPGMVFNEDQQNCTTGGIEDVTTWLNSIGNIDNSNGGGSGSSGSPKTYGHIEVTQLNGSVQAVSISDAFIVRYELGCKHKSINRNDVDFWKWDLFANGTLSRGGQIWSTDEYCFTPMKYKKSWSLNPLTCVRQQRGFRVWIYVICVVLATFINAFMAAFLVSIHRVRNNGYGELLVFYLISIVIGYSALAYLSVKNPMNLSEETCRSIGFVAYYFILLSFLLLNFISWEFWRKFMLKPWRSWKRKFIYALVVLLAFALKFGVKYAQDSKMPQYMKPGIGDAVCWFDVRLMGIFFFYYFPVLVSLILSVYFCSKAYIALWNLPEDKQIDTTIVDVKLAKSQFYNFVPYLIGVISITLREIIVWITARLREHFFIIDFWTGVSVLGLAVTGCICFLWKNKLVQSWWRKNVSNEPDDFLGVIPSFRHRDIDKDSTVPDEMEQIELK